MTFIRKLFVFINIILAIALVAAGWSIYLNPADWWFLSFFGLFYLLFLLINFFFVFFWIVVRLKYLLVSLLAILFTWPVLQTYFGIHLQNKSSVSSEGSIRILSYNVRNFDLYGWNDTENDLEGILSMIQKSDPDIACFQEFYSSDTGAYRTIALLAKEARLPYYHFEEKSKKKNRSWGTAVFSKYPLQNHGVVRFSNKTQNSCTYIDVKIDSATVRVFNIHLQSVYLSRQDHQYLQDISESQDVQVQPTREIFAKLKRAFIFRGEQAMEIEKQILSSPHPVIACGDFNDTPASFAYHTLSNQLQDSFLEAGWGIAPTYSGFPEIFRIDYIFADQSFDVLRYQTICEKYSDHYPITAILRLHR